MRFIQEPLLVPIPLMSQNAIDDYALMRTITSGDPAALRTFYDRHSGAVFALCERMLKDSQEAEQLLTDVFFEIWSSRNRYDEERSNPLTYLMRITRSRAIDRLRRKGPPGSSGSVSLDPASGIDVATDDGPGSAAELDENRTIVINAMRLLDADQRRVIECAYYEGLSHAQIAAKLNKPLGSVKSCIRQAMTPPARTSRTINRKWNGAIVTCQERRDLLLLYVAGGLDSAEMEATREHLLTGCPACAGALAEAEATFHQIPLSLPARVAPEAAWDKLEMRMALKEHVDGPRRRRARIAEMTMPAQRGPSALAWTGWAAAAGVAIFMGVMLRNANIRANDAISTADNAKSDSRLLQQAFLPRVITAAN